MFSDPRPVEGNYSIASFDCSCRQAFRNACATKTTASGQSRQTGGRREADRQKSHPPPPRVAILQNKQPSLCVLPRSMIVKEAWTWVSGILPSGRAALRTLREDGRGRGAQFGLRYVWGKFVRAISRLYRRRSKHEMAPLSVFAKIQKIYALLHRS